jgi:hypothetical protein
MWCEPLLSVLCDRRRAMVHAPFAGYGLFYRVTATGPEVLAVLHLARNPRAMVAEHAP